MATQFTQQQVEKHIASIESSASAIDQIIGNPPDTDEVRDDMRRHMRHIEIMCAMNHIKDSGVDLKPFTDAAARGAAWLAR